MKRSFVLLLSLLMLTGCSGKTVAEVTVPSTAPAAVSFTGTMARDTSSAPEYASRFAPQTVITLSDGDITVEGDEEAVYLSNDIVYYEDRDAYDSGNPYGEGSEADRHTVEEAAAHTVINITKPGAYRLSGKLSAGQVRVDLGTNAYFDPEAVVELILDNADITCTVAPAILFLNTYECDGNWSVETAQADVDTSAAGANLILEGKNTVSGSYVARIYKDKEGEKKLWKQDGAIYSYMSLNVFGPGSLDLTAENEGLDTELHLTVNGGDITVRSGNDGINTNEDGVSVTTVNGGTLRIAAGLGQEGDGIDSNGYLVINGGTVVASAHPAADAGMDSDLGSFVHGGTVIALGSTMDWAESDSGQVTMNLQFARQQSGGSAIVVTKEDGTVVFAYDPGEDSLLGEGARQYSGAIVSCPGFALGETYHIYLDGTLSGEALNGIYTSVTGYENGIQMAYSGNSVGMMGAFPGGMGQMPGGFQGEWPADAEGFEPARTDFPEGEMPEMFGGEMPEDFDPSQMPQFSGGQELPEGFDPSQMGGGPGQRPEGMEDMTLPENFGDMELPEGFDGEMPAMPEGGFGGGSAGEASTGFYMSDKVNAFSGVTPVES